MSKVIIIAALAENHVIGNEGDIPWKIKEELQLFKEYTTGNSVIMGRKTYESLPEKWRPLPNRHNIVVSSTMSPQEGIDVCSSLESAISKAHEYGKDVFICGGAGVYSAALDVADELYLSHVHGEFEGDTHFPEFSKETWKEAERKPFEKFDFVRYTKSL